MITGAQFVTMGGTSTPAEWPVSNLASTEFPKSLAAPAMAKEPVQYG